MVKIRYFCDVEEEGKKERIRKRRIFLWKKYFKKKFNIFKKLFWKQIENIRLNNRK